MMKNKRKGEKEGGRQAVMAETWEPDPDWKPPVHKKSSEQRERIQAALAKALVFKALGPKELQVVTDAFREHQISPGETVIKQDANVVADEPGLFIVEEGVLDCYRGEYVNTVSGDAVFKKRLVCTYDSQG